MWLQSNAIPATVSSVFMKKSLSVLSALMLVAPIAAFAQGTAKIGTVDMQRAFKDYNKTKEAEVKINDAKNAAKKEYDDRAEAYKKALDEINNLNKQLESPALSADKKTGMAKERDDKIANIKSMEREISDFRQTRERQLQEQLMRMREGIVKEITDVVMEKVKAKNLDFVLDKSGVSINGVPVVLYAPESVDFTSEIIATLNKPGRATASALRIRRPRQALLSARQREQRNPEVRLGIPKIHAGYTRVYFLCTGEIRRRHTDDYQKPSTFHVCFNQFSISDERVRNPARFLLWFVGSKLAEDADPGTSWKLSGVAAAAGFLSFRLVWIDRSHR